MRGVPWRQTESGQPASERKRRPARRARAAVLVLGLAAAVAGCLGGGHSRPTCPGRDACPTLASLWPSEDGTAWFYSCSEEIWTTPPAEVFPDPESVPPAPTLDQAYAALRRALAEHPDSSVEEIYRLAFRGRITTESAAEGQRLVGGFLRGSGRDAPAATSFGDPILARLAEVRPDLRPRIETLARRPARQARQPRADGETAFAPLFLYGYCWVRLDDVIGGYGDLSRRLSWIYLTADLEPGSTFRHQLVPELASEVFLHGRVTRRLDVVTAGGTFRDCLECLYLIDYGPSLVIDESGEEHGYFRAVDIGTIVYAPNVGPVQSTEWRDGAFSPASGPGIAAVLRLDLVGRTAP